MVMLNSVSPAFTVCGTTMARHSLPERDGMVAVASTLPLAVTVPSARLMLALRIRLGASTVFSVPAHSPAAKPLPSTSVTRALAIRCFMGRRITFVVGATSATFPHRKSLAS